MALKDLLSLGELEHATYIIGLIFIIVTSLIQISPIKINPWSSILKWLGNQLTGDLRKDLNGLITDVRRRTILQFARECRGGEVHSAEEWAHVLNVADEYEQYCEKHEVVNGVVKQDTQYIRTLYQELSRDHKIG